MIIKAVAPNLRIAVSEEPKPEIAERNDYGPCGYDIWIAYIKDYKKDYAWQRQRDYGESVWFYSLPQDDLPYFSPCKGGNTFMFLLLFQQFRVSCLSIHNEIPIMSHNKYPQIIVK
jgi:hypothetical protein